MPWLFWFLVIPGGLFLYLSIGCALFILTSKLVVYDWRYYFRQEQAFPIAFSFLWPILEPILIIGFLGDIVKHILDRIASIGEVSGRRKE